MVEKSRQRPVNSSGIHVSTFWTAFIVQAVFVIFFAGQGWWRLSSNEDAIRSLRSDHEKLAERYYAEKNQITDRLVKLEVRVENIDKNVEKLLRQVDGIMLNTTPSSPFRK